MPEIVSYPRHLRYDHQRVEANDAVMALLAGSKLAESVLRLSDGSAHRLAEIFPSIEHIARLNLRTNDARAILLKAETHMGALAIPYMLSIHEDLFTDYAELLHQNALISGGKRRSVTPKSMHETFEAGTSSSFTKSTLELFHVVRLLRNSQIHHGGRAHAELADHVANLEQSAQEAWSRITGAPLRHWVLNEPLALTLFEVIGCFAISKRLAEEANVALQAALPRETWLAIAFAHWSADAKPGNPAQILRRALGFTRQRYGFLSVSSDEIQELLDSRTKKR